MLLLLMVAEVGWMVKERGQGKGHAQEGGCARGAVHVRCYSDADDGGRGGWMAKEKVLYKEEEGVPEGLCTCEVLQ